MAWESHSEKEMIIGKVIFEISRKNDVHNNYETDYSLAVNTLLQVGIHTHVDTNTHTCTHMNIHTHVHTDTCTYKHTYIHTHE